MVAGLFFAFIAVVSFIITIIYLLIKAVTKQPVNGTTLFCFWLPLIAFSVLCFVGLSLSSMGRQPTCLVVSPSDVYSTYRIDRRLYPGKNANWQYDHYIFEITPDDKFHLTEIDDKGISHGHIGKVTWSDTNTRRALWSAKLDKEHHLKVDSPILYRSASAFYYVIPSKKYGNMFFRRTGDLPTDNDNKTYPIYEVGFSLASIAAIWFFRYRRVEKS